MVDPWSGIIGGTEGRQICVIFNDYVFPKKGEKSRIKRVFKRILFFCLLFNVYILSSFQWLMSSVMSGVYCLLSRVWYVNCSCLLSIVHIVLTCGKWQVHVKCPTFSDCKAQCLFFYVYYLLSLLSVSSVKSAYYL